MEVDLAIQKRWSTWFQNIPSKVKNVISNITVEPALFVMFLGIHLDHSTLDQMQMDKSCRDDFDFNQTVCQNITDEQYKDQYNEVSDEVIILENNFVKWFTHRYILI